MRKSLSVVCLFLVLLSPAVFADPAASDKPSLYTSQSVTVTAMVEAINHETREVTLRGPEGNVGDTVVAEYEQTLSIEVFANDGSAPGVGGMSVAGRSEMGEMPGAAVMDAVVITATVEEINLEANTFKLKGPEGNVQEYTARDPENLKKAAVGDIVVITQTEAIALAVEKTKSE